MTTTGGRRKKTTTPKALLHVNLPLSLMTGIRKMAEAERRSITSQVQMLLESNPELQQHLEQPENDPSDEVVQN